MSDQELYNAMIAPIREIVEKYEDMHVAIDVQVAYRLMVFLGEDDNPPKLSMFIQPNAGKQGIEVEQRFTGRPPIFLPIKSNSISLQADIKQTLEAAFVDFFGAVPGN